MSARTLFLVPSFSLVFSVAALAQITGPCGQPSNQAKVGCTLSTLYGTTGHLPVYQGGVPASGNDGFDFAINPTALNSTLGTELTTLPLTAPGSGFVFQLDKATGLEVRSTQSLGPILAERGETIGRHKAFVAFTYEYFKFGSENGISLRSLHNVIQHEQDAPLEAEDSDLVTTNDAIDLKIHEFTAFATVGLTDRIDVSAVIPFLNVRMGAYSTATILNISQPLVHAFCPFPTLAAPCTTQSFTNFKEATGIGDVVFRVKARVWGGERTKLAVGTDVRVPTGDDLSFRGSGTWGVRPFAALSYTKDRFAPHVNFGFQANGDSLLAGNLSTGTTAHLPNELTYSAGTDIGITHRFTIAADWLGEHVINGFSLVQTSCSETYPPSGGAVSSTCIQGGSSTGSGTTTYPLDATVTSSYNIDDLALGAKLSPFKNLLITFNGLFKLDDAGLRSTVVPLVGIGYTF
jgi:outer membrane putative beta-barrel porin/alpha-amylase